MSDKTLIDHFSGQGNTLVINRQFIRFMNNNVSGGLFLSQVIYWSSRTKNLDGWFYKTYDQWFDEIMVKEHTIKKSVEYLKSVGVLETKVKKINGVPTLHYRFLSEEFSKIFTSFLQECSKVPVNKNGKCEIPETPLESENSQFGKREFSETTTNTKNTNNTLLPVHGSKCVGSVGFSINGSAITNKCMFDRFVVQACDKLHDCLKAKRRIMRRYKPREWQREMAALLKEIDLNRKEFMKIFKWYCQNIGGEYVPDARSAAAFREKFDGIVAAMQRDEKQKAKENRINGYEPPPKAKVKRVVNAEDVALDF